MDEVTGSIHHDSFSVLSRCELMYNCSALPSGSVPGGGRHMPTVRELRLRQLWSQRELARRAGVAEGTIVTIETGQRLPRLLTMRRIADALGVEWVGDRRIPQAIEEKVAA